jgi:hypothetical protein
MTIPWFIFASLLSFVCAWLIALFGQWRGAQQEARASRLEKLTDPERVMRYLRRGRYGTQRALRNSFDRTRVTIRRSFVFLFPKSKKVFNDIDPLTGLEHGPSSYFLMEISTEAKKAKPIRRTKKNV